MIKKNGFTILLVIVAFISFFIGEEFQHGTVRNALSLGRSRTHYYLSKLVLAALALHCRRHWDDDRRHD